MLDRAPSRPAAQALPRMSGERAISEIVVGVRLRRDLGDIASLAASIADIGLLHPIVVSQDGLLLAGERRLEACRLLGWETVPVTIIEVANGP
ncbi:chromosome partitioning protein, ParB family [Rhizobiales bacterium GAS191]|nr:chromosome partitioning protein, ParB family [Rhizobiales bacterium GAS191]